MKGGMIGGFLIMFRNWRERDEELNRETNNGGMDEKVGFEPPKGIHSGAYVSMLNFEEYERKCARQEWWKGVFDRKAEKLEQKGDRVKTKNSRKADRYYVKALRCNQKAWAVYLAVGIPHESSFLQICKPYCFFPPQKDSCCGPDDIEKRIFRKLTKETKEWLLRS